MPVLIVDLFYVQCKKYILTKIYCTFFIVNLNYSLFAKSYQVKSTSNQIYIYIY